MKASPDLSAALNFEYVFLGLVIASIIFIGIWWYQYDPETNPIKIRMRQANRMNWRQTSEVEENGQVRPWTRRSVRFERGRELAILWHKDATVTLIRHQPTPVFDDFIELEQWIKKNPRDSKIEDSATGEKLYLREISRFVKIHGHEFSLLETEATDKDLFMGVYKLYKAGYNGGYPPDIVAALILDALTECEKDRGAALRSLAYFEDQFRRELSEDRWQA